MYTEERLHVHRGKTACTQRKDCTYAEERLHVCRGKTARTQRKDCMYTEERLLEEASRKWPSASQGERPFLRGNQLCHNLDLGLPASTTEKINFCCLTT